MNNQACTPEVSLYEFFEVAKIPLYIATYAIGAVIMHLLGSIIYSCKGKYNFKISRFWQKFWNVTTDFITVIWLITVVIGLSIAVYYLFIASPC